MILDQGIGAHHAQLEYFGLGAAWTWVSGEAAVAAVALTANLSPCHGSDNSYRQLYGADRSFGRIAGSDSSYKAIGQ